MISERTVDISVVVLGTLSVAGENLRVALFIWQRLPVCRCFPRARLRLTA
jgi:hypothetical protein